MKFRVLAVVLICSVFFFGCKEENSEIAVNSPVTESAAPEGSAPVSTQAGLTWVFTMSEGLSLAKAGNKPVMIDFYADWCGWCKKLDKDVYTDPEVISLSKEFVCVKIDTDKYGRDASQYGVQGLPTIVFLNPDGTVKDKVVGYSPAASFAASMKKVLGK